MLAAANGYFDTARFLLIEAQDQGHMHMKIYTTIFAAPSSRLVRAMPTTLVLIHQQAYLSGRS